MRKIAVLLLMLATQIPLFAQLQLGESGKAKTLTKAAKEASYIEWIEDGFYFKVADYDCAKYHLYGDNFTVILYLGQNAQEIKQSALTLTHWFENAKNDEFVYTTNKNGQKVCLYKFNANIYMSYGSEVNCRATRVQFGADMAMAIAGGLNGQANAYTSKKERDELMANIEFGDRVLTGVCSFKKDFTKSINNFREPGQVDDNYKREIIAEIQKNKKLYSDKGLLESVVYMTCKDYTNQKINSTSEEDWKNIAQLQKLLISLAKGKHAVGIETVESELQTVNTLDEKITILLNY